MSGPSKAISVLLRLGFYMVMFTSRDGSSSDAFDQA
jgi:hypothetical protein